MIEFELEINHVILGRPLSKIRSLAVQKQTIFFWTVYFEQNQFTLRMVTEFEFELKVITWSSDHVTMEKENEWFQIYNYFQMILLLKNCLSQVSSSKFHLFSRIESKSLDQVLSSWNSIVKYIAQQRHNHVAANKNPLSIWLIDKKIVVTCTVRYSSTATLCHIRHLFIWWIICLIIG